MSTTSPCGDPPETQPVSWYMPPAISLRDHFAGIAMMGMRANPDYMERIIASCKKRGGDHAEAIAAYAYNQADHMLNQRDK